MPCTVCFPGYTVSKVAGAWNWVKFFSCWNAALNLCVCVCEKADIVGIRCCGGGIRRHTADFSISVGRGAVLFPLFIRGIASFTVFINLYQRTKKRTLHRHRITKVLRDVHNLQLYLLCFTHFTSSW